MPASPSGRGGDWARRRIERLKRQRRAWAMGLAAGLGVLAGGLVLGLMLAYRQSAWRIWSVFVEVALTGWLVERRARRRSGNL